MQHIDSASSVLRVDLNALVENYRIIQQQCAPAMVAAVVKANGYGLGAPRVAQALIDAGCRHFFVAHLGEAIALKPTLPTDASLFILNGLPPGAEAECAAIGAIPVLNSLDQVDRWVGLARRLARPLPAALQSDSGMSRLGLSPEEVESLVANRDRLCGVTILLLLSHLACADDPDAPFNHQQKEAFKDFAGHFPGVPLSLDNSGGAFLKRGHFAVVRAGIALYGGAPAIGPNPMRPVISLEARIIQVRTLSAGIGVGYGLSYKTGRVTRIATIAIGYADGWPRCLGNKGAAFIGGIKVPIVGRVSMDSITLDVTDVPEHLVTPHAPVELIGPHQTIDDVAADAGTISYEILTQLGQRYYRDYCPVALCAPQRSDAA